MKLPYHVYWGTDRGVVVTRDPREEGGRPEVAFTSNAVSLDGLKTVAAIALAGVFILLKIFHLIRKNRRRKSAEETKTRQML